MKSLNRLTNLPEPIIHHILSFLDMKHVVPTSMLSKKWRYLWVSLPYLNFNREEYLQSISSSGRYCRYTDFTSFINRVLLFRDNSPIIKLRIHFGFAQCNTEHIDSWIRTALWRNVEVLDIQFLTKIDFFLLPDPIYVSKSLKSLVLDLAQSHRGEPVIIPIPEFMNLPNLRNLSLKSLNLMGTELLDLYLEGCPLLESLSLSDCDLYDFQTESITISSSQLKHLVIEYFEKHCESPYEVKIFVSAPNLVSFSCSDYTSHDYTLEDFSCLESTNMDMVVGEGEYLEESDSFAPGYNVEDSKRLMKFLKVFSNVKSLTLNHNFLEVVSEAPEILGRSTVPFSNLRYLKLVTCLAKAYLRTMMYLLKNSPNIETLVVEISLKEESFADIAEYWGIELSLPHLKVIKVRNVQSCVDHELSLLKLLLKNAKTLEKMILVTSKEWSTISRDLNAFSEELLRCSQASSGMSIEFRESIDLEQDQNLDVTILFPQPNS